MSAWARKSEHLQCAQELIRDAPGVPMQVGAAGTEVQARSAPDFMARAMSQPPPAGAASLLRPPTASSLGNKRSTGTGELNSAAAVRMSTTAGKHLWSVGKNSWLLGASGGLHCLTCVDGWMLLQSAAYLL